MTKVMLRLIQDITPDKWQQLEGIDKKFNEIELKMGFPSKKRYRGLVGPHNYMLVIERIWESMAKMEEVMEKANYDPEYLALSVQLLGIVKSSRMEVYLVL